VVIFEVDDERATAARFYLEPVDQGNADVNAAVQATVGQTS
jgi:acyl-CoA synthetase (NDP forming)